MGLRNFANCQNRFGVIFVALVLTLFAAGCKKKTPPPVTPPPPPPAKVEAPKLTLRDLWEEAKKRLQ